jgi:hypothetical protein
MQSKALDYKSSSENQTVAKKNALQSGKAVKDSGAGVLGAVNRAVYGDQVAPAVMDMVKDEKGKEAIKAYNASVVQRDAKREELSGVDSSLQEAQSADTLRQKAVSTVKGDLSKQAGYGSNLKPEEYAKYEQTQFALGQYKSGKIDIKDASLDSVRKQLIEAAGGGKAFDEMDSKSGLNPNGTRKTEVLQADRKRIAEELATGESKTAELETMMMEYLKTVTGAANQRDTAQTMGPDGKPKEEGTTTQQSTIEKREVTSNINIKIEGSAMTPEFQSQLRPVIVAEVQKINRENSQNSGEQMPKNGPPAAIA